TLVAAGASVWTSPHGEPEDAAATPTPSPEPDPETSPSPPELGEHSARELARQHREQALAMQRVRAHLRQGAHTIIAARKPRWSRLPLHVEPSSAQSSPASFPSDELDIGITDHADRVALLARTFARLAAGELVGVGGINELTLALMDDAERRPTALVRDVLTA